MGTATMRPNAVQFMASEILADRRFAFSAGFAVDTAENAWIKPLTVPSRQRKVVSALLELREDLHHAFLHRLLDVVTAPDGALHLEPGAEQPGQGRLALARDL